MLCKFATLTHSLTESATRHFRDCEEYVLCCKYSPLGDVFAVGLGNGAIKVSSKDEGVGSLSSIEKQSDWTYQGTIFELNSSSSSFPVLAIIHSRSMPITPEYWHIHLIRTAIILSRVTSVLENGKENRSVSTDGNLDRQRRVALRILQVYSKAGQFQYILTDDDTKTRRN